MYLHNSRSLAKDIRNAAVEVEIVNVTKIDII